MRRATHLTGKATHFVKRERIAKERQKHLKEEGPKSKHTSREEHLEVLKVAHKSTLRQKIENVILPGHQCHEAPRRCEKVSILRKGNELVSSSRHRGNASNDISPNHLIRVYKVVERLRQY